MFFALQSILGQAKRPVFFTQRSVGLHSSWKTVSGSSKVVFRDKPRFGVPVRDQKLAFLLWPGRRPKVRAQRGSARALETCPPLPEFLRSPSTFFALGFASPPPSQVRCNVWSSNTAIGPRLLTTAVLIEGAAFPEAWNPLLGLCSRGRYKRVFFQYILVATPFSNEMFRYRLSVHCICENVLFATVKTNQDVSNCSF